MEPYPHGGRLEPQDPRLYGEKGGEPNWIYTSEGATRCSIWIIWD